MLQDMIQTPEQLSIDECISSPIDDQILDFVYDGDLFEETIDERKISAPSNYTTSAGATATVTSPEGGGDATVLSCYEDSSFASSFSQFESSDILSALLNTQSPPDPEPDILTSVVVGEEALSMLPMTQTYPCNQRDELDQMISNSALTTTAANFTSYSQDSLVSPLALSGYLGLEPSCSFLNATSAIGGDFYSDGMGATTCVADGELMLFSGAGMAMGPPEVRTGAVEACGLGIYASGSMQRVFSSGDIQLLGDGQHLVGRCSSSPAPLQVASDISTMDDSTYKVGRLSVEERKEKIHRYQKKRNERNFSKKIKYACRKTLADSRPRVRGRFAKNDEFSEVTPRPNSAHHEYDDDEEMVMKDEEDMLQSSDILAHYSGVNSFKYNYTVESWI